MENQYDPEEKLNKWSPEYKVTNISIGGNSTRVNTEDNTGSEPASDDNLKKWGSEYDNLPQADPETDGEEDSSSNGATNAQSNGATNTQSNGATNAQSNPQDSASKPSTRPYIWKYNK